MCSDLCNLLQMLKNFNYRKKPQGYSLDKSFPSLICHSLTLQGLWYTQKLEIFLKSIDLEPRKISSSREILSSYIVCVRVFPSLLKVHVSRNCTFSFCCCFLVISVSSMKSVGLKYVFT